MLPAESNGSMPTCFIVGEIPEDRAAAESLLEDLGYWVESFNSSAVALAQYKKLLPDALLVDERIAGEFNAAQLIEELRQVPGFCSPTVVIYVTSKESSLVRLLFGRLGVECIEKPFSERDFGRVFDLEAVADFVY